MNPRLPEIFIASVRPAIRRPAATAVSGGSKPWTGFASPTSNTTYCPNQFFDVCLPHSSRGVVRLVAYMIRRTLGWCDAQGKPQEERVAVSYRDIETRAGISRDMIRAALDEAVAGHFIRCVRPGKAKRADDGGQTALYELCWDDSPEYEKDPKRFRGFFEGEGNRTDIPNEFFDRLIPREPLAVLKTVGSIVRFSIGFQARRGVRRQHVRLSYSDIQRYARIRSRATLSQALKTALARNYVARLEAGVFDPDAGRESRAAVYALKWADGFGSTIGRKSEPDGIPEIPDRRSEIRTGDRSENRTGNGRKSVPEDRSENRTGIETKHENDTFKHQDGLAAAAIRESREDLRKQGFDPKTAASLAELHSKEEIDRQIAWLPLRNPARNAVGMLRRAIEENWPDPAKGAVDLNSAGAVFASAFYAAVAGNAGRPLAEPSAGDAAAAQRFLQRLAPAAQGEPDPADWGRAFGRMIAEDAPILARGGIGLVLALRLRGDGFHLRRTASLEAARAKADRIAREAHKAAHRAAWIEFIGIEELRVKDERPDEYARFEAHRAEERRRMIESPWAAFIEERLARYDRAERRLLDFQKFFATEVLGFWEWDGRLNPKPFASASFPAPAPTPITP